MKKLIVLITLFTILSFTILDVSTCKQLTIENNKKEEINNFQIIKNSLINSLQKYNERFSSLFYKPIDTFTFSPIDVDLVDDAFHGSESLNFAEWWYFDATFDFGYSLQINLNFYNILTKGFASSSINLYYRGEPISTSREFYTLDEFVVSDEIPLIKIRDKTVMYGIINNETGQWEYNLILEVENISVDLQYYGITKGWKGITPVSSWGVFLPSAIVKGKLELNDEVYYIGGMGYHDHNWDVTIFSGLNYGWFWGDLQSSEYTITWADILTTLYSHEKLAVLNKKDSGYYNIPSDDIRFIYDDFRLNHGMFIPQLFIIDIDNTFVQLHVEMEASDIHFSTIRNIINYWRYHLDCIGTIKVDGETMEINGDHITEFIRFRFF